MKLNEVQFDSFRLKSQMMKAAIVLRLAVLLYRGRGSDTVPAPQIEFDSDTVSLAFDAAWIENHALTRHDLDLERRLLKRIGIQLDY